MAKKKANLKKAKNDDAESVHHEESSKDSSSNKRKLKQDVVEQNLSKNVPVCQNSSIYDKVIEMYKNNNIIELLANVEQWDLNIHCQFKNITKFECLVCLFKTDNFYVWKCHIMSISHLAHCLKINDLFSNVCTSSKKCKVLLYGSQQSIIKHHSKHISYDFKISGLSFLMSEVMKRGFFEQDPLYFCSHCKKFARKPVHDDEASIAKIKCPVKYYCKFCRVHFFSSPEMINYHSLTVEHMTLKCFYELYSNIQINSNEIKQSEQDQTKLSILKQDIPLVQKCNPIKADNRQHPQKDQVNKRDSSSNNVPICENCSMCAKVIEMHKYNNINELLAEVEQWDLSIQTSFKHITNFECLVCFFKTSEFYDWKCHIMSISHLAYCHKINDLYSKVCNRRECIAVLYGPQKLLNKHTESHLRQPDIAVTGIPVLLFEVMRRFFAKHEPLYYCSHCKQFADQPIHEDETSIFRITNPVKFYCEFCRVHFFSSPDSIDLHSLSVEHMTLKCFYKLSSQFKVKSVNFQLPELKRVRTKRTEESSRDTKGFLFKESEFPILKGDNPLFQRRNYFKAADCEHPRKNQVNKTLLDNKNIERAQKSHVNNVLDRSDGHAQSSRTDPERNMQSTDIKQYEQYQKYFEHKIKLLSTLRDYTDRIVNTLSYYCMGCDFLCEEKQVWDHHNKSMHADNNNRPTVFCPTCFIMIIGMDANDHDRSIEHCNLLEFIKLEETDEIENTAILDSVDRPTTLREEFERQIALNITDRMNGVDLMQVETEIIPEEYVHCKKSQTEITSTLDDTKFPSDPISRHLSRVFDKFTDSEAPENEKSNEFDDKSYGQYVAQRLMNVEDARLKLNIKLEIDYLFYSKMKQSNTKR